MSTQTWIREIRRMLDDMGVRYTYQYTRRHLQFRVSANGRAGIVLVSLSPSDHRAIHNIKKDVKRVLGLASYTQLA